MNNLSKLTALLLAIVLALGVPMAVFAESAETIDDLPEYEAEVSAVLAQLYDAMMASATYEELLALTETMTRTEVENYLTRLLEDNVDEDLSEYDAHIVELFNAYMNNYGIVDAENYTNVGPFLDPITAEETATYSLLARSATDTGIMTADDDSTTSGLEYDKDVDWDQTTNTGTITIEAYSTGATITSVTYSQVPTDIVLVLDLSKSMSNSMSSSSGGKPSGGGSNLYTAVSSSDIDTSKTYFVNANGSYIPIRYCTTCATWTSGCNHLSSSVDVKGTVYSPNNYTFYTSQKRLDALWAAIENFVYEVYEKALGEDGVMGDVTNTDGTVTNDDVKHRISIITFNGDADMFINGNESTNYANGLVDVSTSTGQASVSASVTAAMNNQNTGTYTYEGIQEANSVFAANPIPLDGETARQRVLIVFTDGSPNGTNAYDQPIADANTAKKTYGATTYTIGVVDGADPTASFTQNSTSDMNKFLHYISSNYPNATSMTNGGTGSNQGYYLSAKTADALYDIFHQIASNIQSGGSTTELTEETVVKDVLTNTFQLPDGASSVRVYVADVNDATGTTPTFKDRVLMYGTEADGTTAAVEAYKPTISADGMSISVSGFNFSENWVGTETAANGSVTTRAGGKKLIIEIDIEPVDGFLGGNDVETNVEAASGIYPDSTTTTPTVTLPNPPNVNVNIEQLEIVSNDQHIYLGNAADLDALLESFSTQYWIVNSDNSMDGIYTVNKVRNEYATIVFTLETTNNAGETVEVMYTIPAGADDGVWTYYVDGVEKPYVDLNPVLMQDTTVEVSYEVQPTKVQDANGEWVTYVEATKGTLYPTIHVHTPTLTFADSVEDYQATVLSVNGNAYYTEKNYKGMTWDDHSCTVEYTDADDSSKHTIVATYKADGTYSMTETVETTNDDGTSTTNTTTTETYTILGTAPTPVLTYTPDLPTWQTTAEGATTGTVEAIEDVPVNVAVSLNGTDYTSLVTTVRNACTVCGHEGSSGVASNHDPEFVIHITKVMGSLKITKQAGANTTFDPNETFVFTVKGTDANNSSVSMTVTIKGEDSVTINNLLVGDYTVTEDLAWSWRYEKPAISVVTDDNITVNSPSVSGVTVPGAGSVTVTFTNSVENQQWIDGNTYAENKFEAYTETN